MKATLRGFCRFSGNIHIIRLQLCVIIYIEACDVAPRKVQLFFLPRKRGFSTVVGRFSFALRSVWPNLSARACFDDPVSRRVATPLPRLDCSQVGTAGEGAMAKNTDPSPLKTAFATVRSSRKPALTRSTDVICEACPTRDPCLGWRTPGRYLGGQPVRDRGTLRLAPF